MNKIQNVKSDKFAKVFNEKRNTDIETGRQTNRNSEIDTLINHRGDNGDVFCVEEGGGGGTRSQTNAKRWEI